MNVRRRARAPGALPRFAALRGFARRSWQWLESRILRGWRWLARTARLAIGIPDYADYCSHMRDHHDGTPPLTRDEFFRDRLQARYGRGRSRCC